MKRIKSGDRFGALVAIRRLRNGDNPKTKHERWICCCDCGEETVFRASHLRSGTVHTCGCGRIKYRMSDQALARIWRAMIHRCTNPKSNCYYRYGGRGILVCEEWQISFAAFKRDMGPRPSPNHSVERIDVNGNYEPANCRWATISEQARNRRNNTMLAFKGRVLTIVAWAEVTGIAQQTISGRLTRGWSVERALTEPTAYRGINNHSRNRINPRLALAGVPLFREG